MPPPPSDQRKRGSDRGEPRGSFAAGPTAGKQLAASAAAAASTPTKSAGAGATTPPAVSTAEAGGSTSRAAGTQSASTAAAAATPVAVSIDAAGGQKSFTTMYCEAGDSVASFIRPGVTFIKVDSAGVASVCDVSIIQNDGNVNSSSSSNAAGSGTGGMKGFDECKAPATDASGVFSMGSSSSRAAFGRRRRRVGG